MNLGLIGLGRMGGAIASRLVERRFNVIAYDQDPRRLGSAEELSIKHARSPREVADACEVVLSTVTDDAAVRDLFLSENGVLRAKVEGKLFIEMSTILPMTIQELGSIVARRGAAIIDSPVLGSIQAARGGALLALVGGDEAHVDRARATLDVLARKSVHLGPLGSGNAMKLAANLTMAAYLQSLAEGLAIGRHYNLDIDTMLEILSEAPTANPWLASKRNLLKGGVQETTLDIRTLRKDVMCAVATGAVAGIPMPGASGILASLSAAIAAGCGAGDLGELPRFFREHMLQDVRQSAGVEGGPRWGDASPA